MVSVYNIMVLHYNTTTDRRKPRRARLYLVIITGNDDYSRHLETVL